MRSVVLVTAYVYFDDRARVELEPREQVSELPPEISLESACAPEARPLPTE